MSGKLLIVEDEPIVAIDLRDEVQEFGFEVTGLAESADAALMSVEEDKPDMVLMDISIDGSMDGIQAARVLRNLYAVPVVFLTSFSDSETISRATREAPYGYLTKPFKSRDLQAMLRTAMFKAVRDAAVSQSHQAMTQTLQGAHEALVMILANGEVEFMNRSAEELTGLSMLRARGMLISEVVDLVICTGTDSLSRWGGVRIDPMNSLDGCSAFLAVTWSLSISRCDRCSRIAACRAALLCH